MKLPYFILEGKKGKTKKNDDATTLHPLLPKTPFISFNYIYQNSYLKH